MRPLVHAITPGDHFSPQTGSAVPTVIDALARSAHLDDHAGPQSVLVAKGTYPERYDSVAAVEYHQRMAPSRLQRGADLLAGRLSGARPFQQRNLHAMLTEQHIWPPSIVVAHNLIQLVPLVDADRHQAVLYAHNDLFRTYSRREAAKVLDSVGPIVSVSEFLAERIRQRLPGPLQQRVVVVPNAADCETFTPRAAEGTAESGPLRVAFVGRVVPDKGADVLLRAAALLKDPDLEITVVGSTGFDRGAELSSFERTLRELADGLKVPVSFRPFTDRNALPGLLRSQDVLAVPSRWPEPWGLTVSEGQAAGLVVLASNIGGIPEAISDHSHLVPPDDPEALAEQLQRFLADRELLAEHSRSARAHAEAHDWRESWRIFQRHLAKAM